MRDFWEDVRQWITDFLIILGILVSIYVLINWG